MNKETNLEGLNVSPAITKPMIAVRCIDNKGFKKDLKIGKIYQARQSKHFSDSWEFDFDGGIITYKKKRFEVVADLN